MWVQSLGKMQNSLSFKAMVHNPGSSKDCETFEISQIYAALELSK
jgi:arginine/lysine/ornithine decarboxylase